MPAPIRVPHGFYNPAGFEQACREIAARNARWREEQRAKALTEQLHRHSTLGDA